MRGRSVNSTHDAGDNRAAPSMHKEAIEQRWVNERHGGRHGHASRETAHCASANEYWQPGLHQGAVYASFWLKTPSTRNQRPRLVRAWRRARQPCSAKSFNPPFNIPSRSTGPTQRGYHKARRMMSGGVTVKTEEQQVQVWRLPRPVAAGLVPPSKSKCKNQV